MDYCNRLNKGRVHSEYTNSTSQISVPKTIPMHDKNISFQTIDWKSVPKTHHAGTTGEAYWQTMQFEGLRVRYVEYSADYLADHWCEKGHIVYCLKGEVKNELADGTVSTLTEGMSYIVSDELSSHRSRTENGVHLLIIDGDFLKLKQ